MPGCQWAARVWFWEGLSRSSWFFLSSSSSGRWASCPLRRAYRRRPRRRVPCAQVRCEITASSFHIFNGLSLVFGHFQTNQLSVGFLSETEPIKLTLKSQEPVAALAFPHTATRAGNIVKP